MLNVMGWRRRELSSTVVERWIAYARPRRNLTTDAEVEALRVGTAGEACSGEGSDDDTMLMAELNAATALNAGPAGGAVLFLDTRGDSAYRLGELG